MSRVMARMVYAWDRNGSVNTFLMTELPCWPVAPNTARILDILV